jgi:hypothetical protein
MTKVGGCEQVESLPEDFRVMDFPQPNGWKVDFGLADVFFVLLALLGITGGFECNRLLAEVTAQPGWGDAKEKPPETERHTMQPASRITVLL